MSPALAREYLWLGKQLTGKQLYDRGIINEAVPADQLDAKTDEIAQALLRRNAYALAMTKRVLNKPALAAFNSIHDAGLAYEFLNFYMQTPQAKELGKGRGEQEL
jgi:enoyl-CoA hydratase/carnithine racemase